LAYFLLEEGVRKVGSADAKELRPEEEQVWHSKLGDVPDGESGS
jgi:hypothetical protein